MRNMLNCMFTMISVLAVLFASVTVQSAEPATGLKTLTAAKNIPAQWLSEPPAGCPFKPSASFSGLAFTGRHAEYTGADTWYPSWASDVNMYSPWTDGSVNGLGCGSGGEGAATGHATIMGDDPLNLIVTNHGVFKSSPRPYEGRYPCGSLVYDEIGYFVRKVRRFNSELWPLTSYLRRMNNRKRYLYAVAPVSVVLE